MARGSEAGVAPNVVVPQIHREVVTVLAVDLGPRLVRRRLRLEDEPVEVEDQRADHRRSTSSTASESASSPSGLGLRTRTRVSLTAGKRASTLRATSKVMRSTSARGRSATASRTTFASAFMSAAGARRAAADAVPDAFGAGAELEGRPENPPAPPFREIGADHDVVEVFLFARALV